MQVHCPQCSSTIAADDVNLQTLTARCRQCNNIFSIAEMVRAGSDTAHTLKDDGHTPIPLPPRIHVEELGSNWSVSWRWFTPGVIFLILFCCVWDPVVLITCTLGFQAHRSWLTALFPIPFFAAGIAITYIALASVFNKTRVAVGGSDLTVKLGPIPWRGNRTISTDSIRQIFFKPIVTATRNQMTTWYGIYAVDKDANLIQLVSGITDINEATFLQRTLEQKLKLKRSPLWPAT